MSTPNQTSKPFSERDYQQTLQGSFNTVDKSITTAGFLVGKIGHQVTRIDTDSGNLNGAAAGDDFSFLDDGTLLYTIRILYSDLAKSNLTSATRVA